MSPTLAIVVVLLCALPHVASQSCAQGLSSFVNSGVSEIICPGAALTGTIPPQLFSDVVQVIDLRDNNLVGKLPGRVRQATSIQVLRLDDNHLTGTLPRLSPSLMELSVANNQLTGQLPLHLFAINSPISIALDNNDFTGTIPASAMPPPRHFSASRNHLTGPIPPAFLSFFNYMDMSHNQLTGTLPNPFDDSDGGVVISADGTVVPTVLEQRLFLGHNLLSGTVDNALLVTDPYTVDLSFNRFTGPVHDSLLRENLDVLNLEGNRLTGSVPTQLPESLEILNLRNNSFSGTLRSFVPAKDSNLRTLLLDGNVLSDLQPGISSLEAYNRFRSFGTKLSFDSANDLSFDLQGTSFGEALETLWPLRNSLEEIHLAHQNMSGTIPDDLARYTKLKILDVRANALQGSIPDAVAELPFVSFIVHRGNRLTGSIPGELAGKLCAAGEFDQFDPDISATSTSDKRCVACPVGTFQPYIGQRSCTPCEFSTFAPERGATHCTVCPPNKIVDVTRSKCALCGDHHFVKDQQCKSCLSESPEFPVTDIPGGACVACPVGYVFQVEINTCGPCARNQHVVDGRCEPCDEETPVTLSLGGACEACPPQSEFDRDLQVCVPCSSAQVEVDGVCTLCNGYVTANYTCAPCPTRMTFNPDTQVCEICVANHYVDDGSCKLCVGLVDDLGDCVPCPPGTVLKDGICTDCPVDSYEENNVCVTCTSPLVTKSSRATSARACVSPSGMYIFETEGHGTQLLNCPIGARCPIGTSVHSLEVEPGFWRGSADTAAVVRCPSPTYCEQTSPDLSSPYCTENHEGPYCESCTAGFAKRGRFSVCEACSEEHLEQDKSRLITIAAVFAALLLLIVSAAVFHARKRHDSRTKSGARILWIKDSLYHWKDRLQVKLRILVGFFQIMFAYTTMFGEVYFPSRFVALSETLTMLYLQVAVLFNSGCVFSFNHYAHLVIYTVIPLVAVLVVLLLHTVALRCCKASWFDHDRLRYQMVKGSLLITFLFYPGIASIIFQTFLCIDVGDASYLAVDLSISCDSDSYISVWRVYGLVCVGLFVVGIPLVYVYMLRSKHTGMEFLTKPYRDTRQWFEVQQLFMKLLQSSVVLLVFADMKDLQLMVAMLLCFIAILCLVYFNPYKKRADAFLAIMVQVDLVFVCFLGMLHHNGFGVHGWLNLAVAMCPLVAAMQVLYGYCKNRRALAKKTHQQHETDAKLGDSQLRSISSDGNLDSSEGTDASLSDLSKHEIDVMKDIKSLTLANDDPRQSARFLKGLVAMFSSLEEGASGVAEQPDHAASDGRRQSATERTLDDVALHQSTSPTRAVAVENENICHLDSAKAEFHDPKSIASPLMGMREGKSTSSCESSPTKEILSPCDMNVV